MASFVRSWRLKQVSVMVRRSALAISLLLPLGSSLMVTGCGSSLKQSSTTLTASASTIAVGASVTLTAKVTPTASTGTVTFYDGGTSIGTGSLAAGVATLATTTLAAGTHSITAGYGGNTGYDGSTSAAVTITVAAPVSTTTTLNASATAATTGTPITLTAAVSPSTATGTVTFYDQTTSIGTGTLSSGSATLATSSLPAGPNSITAVYGGDSNDIGSTSAAVNISITLADSSQVTGTSNPQVADYMLTLQQPGTVTVSFGTTTSYGFETSSQHYAAGAVNLYVTGMRQSTLYHMAATVAYDSGVAATDADHTFMTGVIPSGLIPSYAVSTTNGLTPQPGIEFVDLLQGTTPTIPFGMDLAGNVIWTYLFPDRQSDSILYPIKLQTNGDLIMLIAPASQTPLTTPPTASTLNVLREIDLAGNVIRQLTMTDLNTKMAAAGFNITLQLFSHDFAVLPNGHILVIANTLKQVANVTGYTGTQNVLGDVVVDLDTNLNPVWVWNEFDHLDVNRHPYMFPDWTHSNALAYSADDGNFLISIRHQNWIIKVDYNNGAGAGDILWKLGYQGDFTLQGATDPTDWFYAQHDVNFVSTNTTGTFQVGIMDNGDDRVFPAGVTCGTTGEPACEYTTAQVMQVDESAKTASFIVHDIVPTLLYSAFAGDTRVQPNGNVEFNLSGVGSNAFIFEVTPTAPGVTPQTVWQMSITGDNTYRAFRMPSMYPGVQW